ncbi:MAG: alcohol dehydrogenase catalytic domain-containing protein [Bryobacterales bacterium]
MKERNPVSESMMAAVLHGKEDLRIEQVPVPTIGPRDILVKVGAALTCGTDLKVFRRGHHAKMINPPALFGHELAGDVVAVGSQVTKFKVGQRVVAANSAPCGECFYCRRQKENLCEDLLFNNGAYAQYMRIRIASSRKTATRSPPAWAAAEAAMAEPLACVLHGIEHGHPRRGYGDGAGAGADRADVRAVGDGCGRARDRRRPPLQQLERAARIGLQERSQRAAWPQAGGRGPRGDRGADAAPTS